MEKSVLCEPVEICVSNAGESMVQDKREMVEEKVGDGKEAEQMKEEPDKEN